MKARPVVVLSPGEPAGIGPDIVLDSSLRSWPGAVVAVADGNFLEMRKKRLGLDIQLIPFDGRIHQPGVLQVLHKDCPEKVVAGKLDPANAGYVLECLRTAALGCAAGEFSALVTGPVQKSTIIDSGVSDFTGHTEFLGDIFGCGAPVMMLACESMRVALVTTHLPLRLVPDAITAGRLKSVIRTVAADLDKRFGIPRANLAICGLNPHAGESGHLGTEERDVITPVIRELSAKGYFLNGPLPADTVFVPENLRNYDAVISMYHDQGLPVIKHSAFSSAVNITLGLPIIRTSVDHGTAVDLAGTGIASSASLDAAIKMAFDMAGRG